MMSTIVSSVQRMSRLGQIQVGLAVAAVVAALASSIYLASSTLMERQACYGVKPSKNNPCTTIDAGVVMRLIVVLGIVLALYIGAALLVYALQRATDSFARTTALMFLLMLTALILLMTLSALSGPGFYLLPSLVLLVAAVLVGIAAQLLGVAPLTPRS